jgi:hypothetical protein
MSTRHDHHQWSNFFADAHPVYDAADLFAGGSRFTSIRTIGEDANRQATRVEARADEGRRQTAYALRGDVSHHRVPNVHHIGEAGAACSKETCYDHLAIRFAEPPATTLARGWDDGARHRQVMTKPMTKPMT